MDDRSPDDRRPEWYRGPERLFAGLLRGTRVPSWLWGLGIIALALYGLWRVLFRTVR